MKTSKYPIAEYDDLEMPSDDMDTDIRNWHSHLVKVRKDTKCVYCGAPISKGDFALSERGFYDGKPFLIHDCIDCADDLIAFDKGEIDSEEYYGRWETRHKKYAEGCCQQAKQSGPIRWDDNGDMTGAPEIISMKKLKIQKVDFSKVVSQ